MKKKILIISYTYLKSDPRILRQLDFLGNDFDVYTAGLGASLHLAEKGFTKIPFEKTLDFHRGYSKWPRRLITVSIVLPILYYYKLRNYFLVRVVKCYDRAYWNFVRRNNYRSLSGHPVDIIIANDIKALPLACKLKNRFGSKIYFDAHEYSPLEYEHDAHWLKNEAPLYTALCIKYIPKADYCTTVSKNIAIAYKKLSGQHFDIITNAPAYEKLPVIIRDDNKIKYIHHGGVSPDRKTIELIRAFKQISSDSNIELHLMLVNLDSEYGKQVINEAAGGNNIFFHPPVPTKEIARSINQFDAGIYFLPPLNFNQQYALPNKFFEFVQARLMIVVGPSIEMAEIIGEHGLGIVADGFEEKDIINSIQKITKEIIANYKQKVESVTYELSSDAFKQRLVEKIQELIK